STTISGDYPTLTNSSAIATSTAAAGVTSVVAGNGLAGTPGNTISTTGTLSLANSGVVSGAYGSAPSTAAIFTVDATGRITNAANLTVSTPTAISGDAQGPLGSTTVTALRGQPLSAITPTTGQLLQFNGTSWVPYTPTLAAGPWYKPSASVVGLTTITDNVGIGTTSPLARLDVTDNTTSTTFNLYNGNSGNYTGAQLNSLSSLYTTHTANDGSGVALDVVKAAAATSGRAAQFAISNAANASDVAVFSTNGNGSGVVTSASGTGYALKASNSAAGRAGLFQGGLDVSGKTSGTGNFALNVTNSSATNLLNVRDDGFVGVNNTSPSAQLDIVSGSFNLMRIATTGTNSNTNIDAYPSGAGQLYFRVPTSNGIGFATSNATRMTIDPSGRVGIGTASPGKTLEVAGNVRINDGTQGLNKVLTSDASGNASWQNPPGPPPIGFFAGNNPVAAQSIPASAVTTVVFGTGYAFFNDGGGYNTGTNQFTPPSAGVYQINAHINYSGGTAGATFQVLLRCAAGHIIRMDGNVPSTGNGSVDLSCTVNSNITSGPYWVEVYCSSAISINQYNSGFSGHKAY
ncbi:MAG: beta strand repeat-containing protein, partial [Bacteroidia bacterium]